MDDNRLFMFNVFSFKFNLMKWKSYENGKKKQQKMQKKRSTIEIHFLIKNKL